MMDKLFLIDRLRALTKEIEDSDNVTDFNFKIQAKTEDFSSWDSPYKITEIIGKTYDISVEIMGSVNHD